MVRVTRGGGGRSTSPALLRAPGGGSGSAASRLRSPRARRPASGGPRGCTPRPVPGTAPRGAQPPPAPARPEPSPQRRHRANERRGQSAPQPLRGQEGAEPGPYLFSLFCLRDLCSSPISTTAARIPARLECILPAARDIAARRPAPPRHLRDGGAPAPVPAPPRARASPRAPRPPRRPQRRARLRAAAARFSPFLPFSLFFPPFSPFPPPRPRPQARDAPEAAGRGRAPGLPRGTALGDRCRARGAPAGGSCWPGAVMSQLRMHCAAAQVLLKTARAVPVPRVPQNVGGRGYVTAP